APYLHVSDLFVLPSESEGFGLALVEAMAAGLPCVSTAVGVAPEVIRDQQNGWVVPAMDEVALERALTSALQRRSEWPAMGAAAREEVAQFEMTRVVESYESLVQSVAADAQQKSLAAHSNVRTNAVWLLGCRIAA